MASQSRRVQSYLEKHNIGALFESLMSQLVGAMPEDPLAFLSSTIQEKQGRKQVSAFRKSTSDLQALKNQPGKSEGSLGSYEKPWRTNSRKLLTKSHEEDQQGEKLDWNPDSKVTAPTFDSFFDTSQPSHVSSKKPQKVQWAPEKTPSTVMSVLSAGGGHPRSLTHDEADELPMAKSKSSSIHEQTASPLTGVGARKRSNSPGSCSAASHQQKAALYLQQKEEKESVSDDSGMSEEDPSATLDTALQVYENPDDLAAEGVKVSKIKLQTAAAPPKTSYSNSSFKVGICARCAKVMQNGLSSAVSSVPDSSVCGPLKSQPSPHRSAASSRNSQISTRRTTDRIPIDTERTEEPLTTGRRTAELTTARSTGMTTGRSTEGLTTGRRTGFSTQIDDSDDEFESISQVSGPRAPIWDSASDLTPRHSSAARNSHQSPSKTSGGVLDKKSLEVLRSSKPVNVVESFLAGQDQVVSSKSEGYQRRKESIGSNRGSSNRVSQPQTAGWTSGDKQHSYNRQHNDDDEDDDSTLLDYEKRAY